MTITKPEPRHNSRTMGKCDCGFPGTHKFAGWECDRCKRLRLDAYKRDNLRGVEFTQPVKTGGWL